MEAQTVFGKYAVTVGEAALAMSCGETTIRNMLRDGILTRTFVGADTRVTAASILDHLGRGSGKGDDNAI